MIASGIVALALAAQAAPPGARASDGDRGVNPPLAIESGRITGTRDGDDVRVYRGIPFAAPPVGPLRWRPPQPPPKWEGVRACDAFGPSCPQPVSPISASGGGAGAQSEDCLHLNVWAPRLPADAARPATGLPVMVWIHGGAFFLGSSSGTRYDGANLARKGVVVVTINYRLGPFGFLGHPQLSKESEHHASGNYGILDQIAALQWVKQNVAAFGGDPGNVTIFGESAGAWSVGCLLASPLAKGLFQRAIAESGAAIWVARELRGGTAEEPLESAGERIVRALVGDVADPIAAARAKSAEALLATAQPSLTLVSGEGNSFGPVADGWVLPELPVDLFEAGRINLVPLLIGTNRDEGTLFVSTGATGSSDADAAALRALYGDAAAPLIDHYFGRGAIGSGGRFRDLGHARAELFGDSVFVAPTRAQVRACAQAGAKCWLYQFTKEAGAAPRNPAGAYHASEIDYVFGHVPTGVLSRYDAADRRLSATMMDYWVQFARTGDPNRAGLPEWPEYVEEEDAHLELGADIAIASGLKAEACDRWDAAMAAVRERAGK